MLLLFEYNLSLFRFESWEFLPISKHLPISYFSLIIGCSSPPLGQLNVALRHNLNDPNECWSCIHQRHINKTLSISKRIVRLLLFDCIIDAMLIPIVEAAISTLVKTYRFWGNFKYILVATMLDVEGFKGCWTSAQLEKWQHIENGKIHTSRQSTTHWWKQIVRVWNLLARVKPFLQNVKT
jgi:hypothetical protein